MTEFRVRPAIHGRLYFKVVIHDSLASLRAAWRELPRNLTANAADLPIAFTVSMDKCKDCIGEIHFCYSTLTSYTIGHEIQHAARFYLTHRGRHSWEEEIDEFMAHTCGVLAQDIYRGLHKRNIKVALWQVKS